MGDRDNVTDPWLQKRVTIPSPPVLEKYHRELALFIEREKGYPKAPSSLRMAHKNDLQVREEVERKLQSGGKKSGESEMKAMTRLSAELFQEAELRPGALNKYDLLVAKDMERYAKELKTFKEVTRKKFDEENGLLPQPSSDSLDEELME